MLTVVSVRSYKAECTRDVQFVATCKCNDCIYDNKLTRSKDLDVCAQAAETLKVACLVNTSLGKKPDWIIIE